MYFRFKETDVFYERRKGKGIPVLLLHGWGCSHETLRPVFDFYRGLDREIITLDFPPFGKSGTPPIAWTVEDYALLTLTLLCLLCVDKIEIFAHSFGARIAALIADKVTLTKLTITGGAGIKPRKTLKKRFKILTYKIKKGLGLSTKKAGSSDYRALSGEMKKTFVSIVNRYTEAELANISAPTLLLWGKHDTETPRYAAKRMNELIKGSSLVELDECGHFAFLDDPRSFFAVLYAFTEDEQCHS